MFRVTIYQEMLVVFVSTLCPVSYSSFFFRYLVEVHLSACVILHQGCVSETSECVLVNWLQGKLFVRFHCTKHLHSIRFQCISKEGHTGLKFPFKTQADFCNVDHCSFYHRLALKSNHRFHSSFKTCFKKILR